MFLWDKPLGRKVFNTTPEFAVASKRLAMNQGLYNGFLVAGLIWIAHVGFDRALGYGLKYASGFGDTHLGRIGRAARRAP